MWRCGRVWQGVEVEPEVFIWSRRELARLTETGEGKTNSDYMEVIL